ncbi:hypothetical protein UT300005_15130 [Clostridium sp. CTA-5]
MFKRANKMTALLVAAAAVVSLVPATGVNAADYKRIESKEGKVYNAIAYKDGKFYIDGDAQDKDDEDAYYLKDGKYSKLENVDTGDSAEAYGAKYVNISEGDYFVDLDNGKVSDDDIKEDNKTDAESALKKKVKDKADDRYANHETEIDLKEISGNKFAETWYEGVYENEDKKTNGGNALRVYTDVKGNYIDADYNLGKIKVGVVATTPSAVRDLDKTINVENTDSKKQVARVDVEGKEKGEKINATASVKHIKTIGQDDKNIYRLARVTVKVGTEDGNAYGIAIKEIGGKEISKDNKDGNITAFKEKDGSEVSFNVIQKISKEQASDTIDGAKYAKTAGTYVLSTDDGKLLKSKGGNEDVANFGKFITGKDYTSDTEFEEVADGIHFTVANNGTVIAYGKENGEEKVMAQALNLKSKNGIYYTDVKGDCSEDVEINDDKMAVDVDVDGNLWRLDGGYIYKFDNDDGWDKVYRVDGAMNELSVYNKDNLVAWSEDNESYSLVGGKEEKEEDKKDEATQTKGWVQATDGTWTYVNDNGVKAAGWTNLAGTWYYLDPTTNIMKTGWVQDGGNWYYCNNSGAMQTGWVNPNGTWYFLNASGAMQTGWVQDNSGNWYFCNGSGAMQANTVVDGYTLGANGAWIR